MAQGAAKEARERWNFLLEFLKVVAGLSAGVLALLAAIYSDKDKVPADFSRWVLLASSIASMASLMTSIGALVTLNNYVLQVQNVTPDVNRRRVRLFVNLSNTSSLLLALSGLIFLGFIAARTILAEPRPAQPPKPATETDAVPNAGKPGGLRA